MLLKVHLFQFGITTDNVTHNSSLLSCWIFNEGLDALHAAYQLRYEANFNVT